MSQAVSANRRGVIVQPTAARRWLWRTLVVMLLGSWAGVTWDRVWHATQPFDDFWSPPHVLVYATVSVVSLMGMYLLFSDHLRPAFGRGFRVFFLPFEVPGALFITGSALGILGFAGAILDNAWHSAFGLNETGWSFPHAMLATSLLMLALGFLSCRLNMADKPIPLFSKVLLAYLILIISVGVFTGPIGDNRTPEAVRFFFTYIPALASQESAQAVFRIYDAYNLNRTHPALLILVPLWLGAALSFLQGLDRRWWVITLIILLAMLTDYGNRDFGEQIAGFTHPGNWQALPILLPTLLFLLLRHWREGVALGLAGFLAALLVWDIWQAQGAAWVAALVSPLAALLGRPLGARAYEIIAHPTSWRAVRPLVLFVIGFPMFTGVLDLWLRVSMAS
jgi:hypothetical protein